ncbi:MAG TPA: endonuclease/exonuclease/phosphatase family protein [Verrucomicrobiae bacterium]|nr:endonuclease/exonuclease/phosphatase family protein [Verrucomicrobiae bacterium]
MIETALIRVATLNIQHGSRGSYSDPGNPELVAEACRQINADVLGLQEVDAGVPRSRKENLAAYAAKACGMDYRFAPTRTFRARGKVGNALLVRGEIKSYDSLKLTGDWQRITVGNHKIPVIREPRNVLIGDVCVNGYDLAVGVIHAGGRRRREMLEHAATALLFRPGPHILLGDYNVRLPYAHETLKPFAFTVLEGGPTSKSEGADEYDQQIDHIAVHGLRAYGVEVMPVPVGDHQALVAEVKPVTLSVL